MANISSADLIMVSAEFTCSLAQSKSNEAWDRAKMTLYGETFEPARLSRAPISFNETIAECLSRELVRFECFSGCGHLVDVEGPERAFGIMREFIMT
jgi:hypothetical protein